MIERPGEDMWRWHGELGHVVCVTTNGFVKANGRAVMGRGCAKGAKRFMPKVEKLLGDHIKAHGNTPTLLLTDLGFSPMLGILPVKHNWWEQADLRLIKESARWLQQQAIKNPKVTYHVPRLGCGNGNRDWEKEVKPLMTKLRDNVWVHSL